MRRIVVPRSASERTISWSCAVSGALSAADGSSMTMIRASRESARRISAFCCSAVRRLPAARLTGQVEACARRELGVRPSQRCDGV